MLLELLIMIGLAGIGLAVLFKVLFFGWAVLWGLGSWLMGKVRRRR